ncbi:hypothetical protein FPANT_13190 [Fusarium pseudoanthophilum]|uniref:Uncharacterized protein n=1 Tax=Fusarium pseudoanthophilum TaxID=48495 RepID=A0A8H5KGL3_9HYPO|nr:hypothetical protein FPANT_13190 [Fusarium pseudoanthophilum]
MAEDEKTLAQQVEILKKEKQQLWSKSIEDLGQYQRRHGMDKQENERLKRQIMLLLEEAEAHTCRMKRYKAKDAEEKKKLQEENQVLKQALAGVESAIAPLKKL